MGTAVLNGATKDQIPIVSLEVKCNPTTVLSSLIVFLQKPPIETQFEKYILKQSHFFYFIVHHL